jgi:phage FluMu protein Com
MIMPSEFKQGNVVKCPHCEKVNFMFHQNLEADIDKLLKRHLGKYA